MCALRKEKIFSRNDPGVGKNRYCDPRSFGSTRTAKNSERFAVLSGQNRPISQDFCGERGIAAVNFREEQRKQRGPLPELAPASPCAAPRELTGRSIY